MRKTTKTLQFGMKYFPCKLTIYFPTHNILNESLVESYYDQLRLIETQPLHFKWARTTSNR